jgi:uncharacterized protein (DUF362 family)/Pyruvate/2-oxoacid:ferredoxin oxidoreductase delta subunit
VHAVIVKASLYEYARLRADLFEILARIDDNTIKRGSNVLIKPNLLTSARPDQAITTHPLIIKAAAEYAISKGASVRISDSPATGSFQRIIRECGIEDALKGMPVEISPLKTSRTVDLDGKWRSIELSAEALDTDVIINLPKLKTHSQMGLTLAVKNLFGCIVGMKKPEWHFRVGENKELFAELLINIYKALKPRINLIDGILGMEGDGPGTGGSPRHLGVLMGSTDALSMDMAVCQMIGIDRYSLLTNSAARDMGLDNGFRISGELPVIRDFRKPDVRDLMFGPRFAHRFMRRHITSRPSNIEDLCEFCNECVKICPAKAVKNPGKRLVFDYEQCIRCYCCLEICPHGAMEKRDKAIKKLLRKILPGRMV